LFTEYADIISIDDLCDMLKIGRNKAYDLLRCKKIVAFKEGRLWMIPKNSVIEYVENRRNRKGCA